MSSEYKKYGKSNTEQNVEDRIKCRQIVGEVLNFGVSQSQIREIIYMLALELEDRNEMIEISSVSFQDQRYSQSPHSNQFQQPLNDHPLLEHGPAQQLIDQHQGHRAMFGCMLQRQTFHHLVANQRRFLVEVLLGVKTRSAE